MFKMFFFFFFFFFVFCCFFFFVFFFFCKQIHEEISHRTEQLLSIFHEKLFSHVEAHVV